MSEATEEIARAAFDEIFARWPHLQWIENTDDPVEISLTVPRQDGLKHELWLALQNEDELHLQVGNFWLEWFPCTKPDRTRAYIDAVSGFISGDYRVLEYFRGDDCIKAKLQMPDADGWRTIGTWSKLWLPSFNSTTQRVVANV
jgi:hypothetical protein